MNGFTQQRGKAQNAKIGRRRAADRGVALLITLALLSLLAAASLAVIFLTDSDTMINGYYRNYRGSFYAADSGANIAVEALKNAIATSANATATGNPLPVSGSVGSTAGLTYNASTPAAFTTALAPFESSYYTIGDTGSWDSEFKVVNTSFGQPTYTFACQTTDSNCPSDGDYIWTYSYPYTVTVQGQSSGTGAEQVTETGAITYSSSAGTSSSGGTPSFSKWAAFITNFALCPSGSAGLVPGTMYGPFFTDGSWNFGNFSNPGYTFNGTIQQAGSQVGYISNGNCTKSGATAPSGFHAPTYNDGQLQISANAVSAPTDQYNQQDAVLNGEGEAGATSMSVLQTINGTQYPSSTPVTTAPQGVYIPYYSSGGQNYLGSSTNGVTTPAGGFYVNGDASVALSATGTALDPTQTYTIAQTSTTTTTTGSGRNQHTTTTTTTTTTTVVVNPTSNTTTLSSNGTTLTLTGIPQQVNSVGAPQIQDDPSGLPVNPTMVYVNGQITGLSGQVQNDNGITITASSGVDITGDLTYLQSPVSNSDVLNSTTNAGVLGVYTPGNITLSPDSGGNLTTDASLAALSGITPTTNATSGFETNGNIGTWTILGGRAEDEAHSVSISASTTLYDQRFAGNFGPPWFPTATISAATPNVPATPPQINVTRTSWTENSR